jgi:ketosteroid isomerase-like protein
MNIIRSAACFIVIFISAPSELAHAQSSDESAINTNIANIAKVFNQKNAASVANLYNENAKLMPPNQPTLEGRPAIKALWQSYIDGAVVKLQLSPSETVVSGNVAYSTGNYSMEAEENKAKTVTVQGAFIIISSKDKQGDWLVERHMWTVTSAK